MRKADFKHKKGGISNTVLFLLLFFFCGGELIAKRHHAVVQMNVFHDSVLILHGDVEMAEIPKGANSKRIKLICNPLHILLWDA